MGPISGTDPNQTPGQFDDVKDAIAQLMQQQQANEPKPRNPTPDEVNQIKQTAMQMIQRKRMGQSGPQGAPGPAGQVGQAAPPPPPPQGMPPQGGPANVPPATGPGSANNALDDILMSAKAQTPLGADVKPPVNFQAQKADTLSSIDETLKFMEGMNKNRASSPPLTPPGQYDMSGMDALINEARTPETPSIRPPAFDAMNALKLGLKLNPATMVQQGVVNKMMEDPQGSQNKVTEGLKGAANVAGDLAGTGRIFNDQPKATPEVAAPAPSAPSHPDTSSPSGTFENFHPGEDKTPTPEVMNSVISTADKVFQSGIDTIDKAKVFIGNDPEFKGILQDPDYKALLDKLENEYATAKQRTDSARPGAAQYIAAALLGLAGMSPQVIAHVLHPDAGVNQEREQLAGQSLMQAQLRGLTDSHKQRQDALGQKRLDEQDKIAQMREQGMNRRADQEFNFKRMDSGRQANLKLAMQYLKSGEMAVTHREKVAAAAAAAPYLKIENEYRKKLGEPALTEQQLMEQLKSAPTTPAPQPQSMGSPQQQQPSQGMQQSAMRLIGLGA